MPSPISYDREYTRYLGFSAVKFLVNGGSGAMIMLKDGKSIPIKFADLIDPGNEEDKDPHRRDRFGRLPHGAALHDPAGEGGP